MAHKNMSKINMSNGRSNGRSKQRGDGDKTVD
jgi:hypothetical protein